MLQIIVDEATWDAIFDVPRAPEPEKMSADRRRTLRRRALLDIGVHPATHRALLQDHTCGECVHHVVRGWEGRRTHRWHKCLKSLLGASSSAASDIRVSWPACELFEASGEEADRG